MTIEAKIIADSIGPNSPRLTTFQLRYPRFIHAEFMTHRVFSRNASSSRAIPVQKQIDMIREDTAMPSHWGKNQSGMQAEEENDAEVRLHRRVPIGHDGGMQEYIYREKGHTAEEAWCLARDRAVEIAQAFHDAGYHKQVVNRILEPFSHISVVCTATDFDNFFWLRRHKDAQPEIKILADLMYDAMQASDPTMLGPNEWHLPYVTQKDRDTIWDWTMLHDASAPIDPWTAALIKVSVARCARVSYLTHDGQSPSLTKDMELYERLVGSEPLHASPAEHQAKPDTLRWNRAELKEWENPQLHGNLTGYVQFRKTLPGEHHTTWEGLNDFDS